MTDQAMSPALCQAAELILQDERVTSDLADPEAEILLRWAVAAAERTVLARLQPHQAAHREAVAEVVRPVCQTARAINDLVAAHGALGEHEFLLRLLALVDSACGLAPGGGVGAPSPPEAPPH